MRKYLYLGIIVIIIVISLYKPGEQRLRIFSSDDSSQATLDKTTVKEVVVTYMLEHNTLSSGVSLEHLDDYLKEHLDSNIYKGITLEVKKVNFPAKVLKGRIIPAGFYETLVITIDKGNGQNWWSLLYPDFFNLNFDDSSEIEYRCYFYDILND